MMQIKHTDCHMTLSAWNIPDVLHPELGVRYWISSRTRFTARLRLRKYRDPPCEPAKGPVSQACIYSILYENYKYLYDIGKF
jgi:hypothetical protein